MQTLIYIAIIILSYEIDVWLDWRKITIKKESPLHGIEALVIIAIYAVLAILFYGFTELAALVLALALNVRWLYFDLRLNMRRDLPLNYIGNTSMMDKLLRKLPHAEYTQYIIKFTLIILTLMLIWKIQPK